MERDTYEYVADVVGEESLSIEHGGDHLSEGPGGHGLAMSEQVHLLTGVQESAEGEDVTPTARRAQHGRLCQRKQFGLLAGQDRVSAK